MQLAEIHNTPAAIWSRVIRPDENDMTPEAARFFLKLSFDKRDLDRMHELTVKNQEGSISPDEREELGNFRQVGLELDLLRAKARGAINHESSGN